MMLIVPEAPAGAAVQKDTINTAESSNSDSSETPKVEINDEDTDVVAPQNTVVMKTTSQ
jgi:hypothetical protein